MSITYIGSTLGVFAGTPATEDAAGYGDVGMTYQEIGKIISIGEIGDKSEDVSFDLLKSGRKTHVNGVKDIGEINVMVEYDAADAGQDIIIAANNSNASHSFEVTDADGENIWFYGTIANVTDPERTANTYKALTFTIRGQSGVTRSV